MGMFKKKGGGFLNGVSGIIRGYKLDTKTWGEGEDAYTTLSVELLIQQDGADETVQQFLSAGFIYDEHSISNDGLTIEGGEGGVVGEDTEFARFLQTLIEQGVPESDFDEDGRNFEAMVGYRVTFAKELNKDRQLAAGKKKLGKAKAAAATEEELMLAGRRQDKTDKKKFYNHDRLIVTKVLGKAEDEPKGKKGAKGAAKPAAKPAPAAGKGAAKGKKTAEPDYEQADAMLVELLGDAKDNTINMASLSSLVVRKALADDLNNEVRDAIRALYKDEAYLGRENGWSFDADDKKKPVVLA